MTDKGQGAEAIYFAALKNGEFLIQRCTNCREHVFFPRELCPHCRSAQLEWLRPMGTGTVYSTSTIRRKPEDGGDYDVSLIDLDEGVRMMSRVGGVNPDEVRIGMRVRACVTEGKTGNLVTFAAMETSK